MPDAVLCFGGSFNPIHYGHLLCARAVARAAGYKRIKLIPSAQPPHKRATADLAAPEHRLAMCRLVEDGLFEADDIELRLPGPSYTLNTARALKLQGIATVAWLVGADQALELPKWHEAEQLLKEVHFVLMKRPGWAIDWDTLPADWRILSQNVVAAPNINISASDIRRQVGAGHSIGYLVPPLVEKYIRDNGLYLAGVARPTQQ